MEKQSLQQILQSGSVSQDNESRLRAWRFRYLRATGVAPTLLPYSVEHCQECNKPVWFINPQHKHFTVNCAARNIPFFLQRQSGL